MFVAIITALAALAHTPTPAAPPPSAEPRIVEFGPSFRSFLGDVTVGADGAIWISEFDGAARLTRDGRITQIRRPDDAWYVPTTGIGLGPAGSVWSNGSDRLLAFTTQGVRDSEVVDSRDYALRIKTFAVTPHTIAVADDRLPGIRLTTPGRLDEQLFGELGQVSAVVAAPNDMLWLLAARRGEPMTLSLAHAKSIVRRDVARTALRGQMFDGPMAAVPDGSLVATMEDDAKPGFQGRPLETIVRIWPDGRVRELERCQTFIWHCGLGAIAAAQDGSVWLSEPYAGRIARLTPDGGSREYRDHLLAGAAPNGIAVDRDGSVWFTDAFRAAVGHLSPADGNVRYFGNGLFPDGAPAPPAIAADGAVWFRETLNWHSRIVRLALDGTAREFLDPFDRGCYGGRGTGCSSLAAAGSGVLFANSIDAQKSAGPMATRLLRDGTLRTASLDGCLLSATNFACLPRFRGRGALRYPFAASYPSAPNSVVAGPDGNLWFTDRERSCIGRVTADGRFAFFTHGLTRWHSGPQYITTGPDGALWFTEIRDRVGRITTDGRITEFSAGIPFRSSIGGIVTGPDKNLWFTLYHGNELARMTPEGAITRFRRGIYPSRGFDEATDSVPVVDRAGNIWFNEPQGGRIARATILR